MHPSRWFLIRHIRYVWYAWQLARWHALWADYFPAMNPGDLQYLEDVWEGKA